MVQYEVVAADKFRKSRGGEEQSWVLLRESFNGNLRYAILAYVGPQEDYLIKGQKWDSDKPDRSTYNGFNIYNLDDISKLSETPKKKTRGSELGLNTPLNFGRWKGYELGIVFLFDPQYVEWCIKNVQDFAVLDIEQLESCGTFPDQKRFKETYALTNDPSLINYWIDEWESIQQYAKVMGWSDRSFRFRDSTKKLNNEKLNS